MATSTSPAQLPTTAAPGDSTRPRAPELPVRATPAITWWALIGGIFLVIEAWVLIRWVTGPYFHHVSTGPSTPPTWMKAAMITWQAVGIPIALALVYWLLIRPWRRDGRITTDGLLVVAFFLVSWQDPLSDYFNQWFTYNAYLVNMGSWVQDVPGWLSFGTPGHMLVEPILWMPFVYVLAFWLVTLFGCWAMRQAHARWPNLGTLGLICFAFVASMIFDVVFEGLIIMPLGFYNYAGGHLALFPRAYNRFPLHEAPIAAFLWTGFAALRYFKDDKGLTVVERGIDKLKIGTGRKNLMRFLAICGMVNVLYLLGYNLPNAFIGANSHALPADLLSRSYFLDGTCGPGTNRACPGPGTPLARGSGSAFLTLNGGLGRPTGYKPRKTVPFGSGTAGPFTGPPF
ncbi:MAG: spirocyclase AveC family protein [Solirubrobacteraceae bacterium]